MKAYSISIVKHPGLNTIQTGIMAYSTEEAVKLIVAKHGLSNEDRVMVIELPEYEPLEISGIEIEEIGENYFKVTQSLNSNMIDIESPGEDGTVISISLPQDIQDQVKKKVGAYRKSIVAESDVTYLAALPLDELKAKLLEMTDLDELPISNVFGLTSSKALHDRLTLETQDWETRLGRTHPLTFASLTAKGIAFDLVKSDIRTLFIWADLAAANKEK